MTGRFAAAALAIAVSASLGSAAAAQNNGLPSLAEGAVLVTVIAERGGTCGLLSDWEAAALRAEGRRAIAAEGPEMRAELDAAVIARVAETACDDPLVNVWIEGARRGIEQEMLSHYLAIYRALSQMEGPPAAFIAAAPRLDYAPVIAAIDAKIAEFEAAGVAPEGGGPWPQFVTRTGAAAVDFSGRLADPDATWDRMSADEVSGMVVASALVVELWFAAEGGATPD
jgi:hypothetical protein